MVAAAVGRTSEQGQIIGSMIALMMGILGGAFFQVQNIPGFDLFTRISIVRWSAEGFGKLASGQSDILPNLIFLVLIGAVLFVFSLWAFNRRQDI
jgi:ABC-type multidrug transport system permease subunit